MPPQPPIQTIISPMRTRRQQLRLPDEVRYIQRRAAAHDGRMVTIGQFVLFSTTGDAWLLDPSDHFAARLARDGDPEPVDIRETDTTYVVARPGKYRIEGPAFVYTDRRSRRVSTILGYPINLLANPPTSRNFKYFWLVLWCGCRAANAVETYAKRGAE